MAQWVGRSLVKPAIRGSNLAISRFDLLSTVLNNCIEKTKIKKKRHGLVHLKTIVLTP